VLTNELASPGVMCIGLHLRPALGKTSIAVYQWTTKQFWVDRQSFKQEDSVYYLVKVQITKLNVYLQFKLNYDVCYSNHACISSLLLN
jgi:hypothetical protein